MSDDIDIAMRRYAAHRAIVLISLPDGYHAAARLIAWRPHDGRSRARVVYSTGRQRSVDVSQVLAPTSTYRLTAGQWERRYGDDVWWPVDPDEVPDLDDLRGGES